MLKDLILDILFPKRCPGCFKITKDDSIFCPNCLSNIKIFNTLFCPRCSNRISNLKKLCHPQEKFIMGAATNYNQIIQDSLHLLKFEFATCVAKPLTNILIKYFQSIVDYYQISLKNFLVIPIPISKKRIKIRGFNQSELIAQIFTDYFKLNLINNVLIRIKNSRPQSEIKSFEKRKLNVLDCFSIINKETIKNKDIILIDDVITSGSTMREAVKILKTAKTRKIIAIAIACV